MAQRGEQFRKETKEGAISCLLDLRTVSLSELSGVLGVSRVTLASLLDELVDIGVLCRPSERAYAISKRQVAVLLKLGGESAEIATVLLGESRVERTPLKLSPSMTYADNAARLLGIADRHALDLQKEGKEVGRAIVCRRGLARQGFPKSVPIFFSEELVAQGIGEKHEGSVLYIDDADNAAYLSHDGKALLSGEYSENAAQALRALSSVLKPDRVVLTGTDEGTRRSTEVLAAEKSIGFSFIESSDIRPDERAALLGIIGKNI